MKLAIVITLLLLPLPLLSQSTDLRNLYGRIMDDSTHTPVPGVNVFLSNTTFSTTTDSNGYYYLRGVPFGIYDLSVSHVSFFSKNESIGVTQSSNTNFNFYLKPRTIAVQGVDVTGESDEEWPLHYHHFKKMFLGLTSNALRCTIKNPEVLTFDNDPKTGAFTAHAEKPLLVENPALGYSATVYLDECSESSEVYRFIGRIVFSELKAPDSVTAFHWRRNRLFAYRGSFRHFLRSAVLNAVTDEGFSYEYTDARMWIDILKIPVHDAGRMAVVRDRDNPHIYSINFPGFLRVVYRNQAEPVEYIEYRRSIECPIETGLDFETSWVQMKSPTAPLGDNGILFFPYNVKVYGFWAFQRFADMLPNNYIPE